MLADRRKGNAEWLRYIRDRHVVFQEHAENFAPGRIGQGREDGIKGLGFSQSSGSVLCIDVTGQGSGPACLSTGGESTVRLNEVFPPR